MSALNKALHWTGARKELATAELRLGLPVNPRYIYMRSAVQSVRFDRGFWDTRRARAWLRGHDYHPIKRVDVTKSQLRYRILEPALFSRYAVKKSGPRGISFVIGFM